MSDINITITNLPAIRSAFNAAPSLMKKAITDAVNKSLLTIGGKAAKSAPVRTGNLRSSILDPDRGLTLATPASFRGSVGSGVGYGAYVELGTRFMKAQPYLTPAVESSQHQVEQFFTQAVDGVLSDIGKRT